MKRKTILILIFLPLLWTPSQGAEPAITLRFQNADVDSVLNFFGNLTNQIFIRSDAVRGFLTVTSPQPVSQNEAMQILQTALDLKGFTLVPGPGRIVRVVTQSEALQSELKVGGGSDSLPIGDMMMTQVHPLKFVSAVDLKSQLAPLLSKGGNLIADERKNALVITDNGGNIRRLIQIIDKLDTRSAQVLIEALIVEVTLTKETKLGLEWSYQTDFHGSDHKFSADAQQTFSLAGFVTEGLRYSVIRGDGKLSALLHLLATDKNVNILSTPHIMTLNNQPALIRVGEEVPVLTQTRNVQGGETIRSFDYKNVTIELEVTPRINDDREVHLQVHPLVKKILGFNAELNAPILATREAQTAVLLNDKETVVIGGLMKDDSSKSQSKIPILGDIPLLGYFFRKEGVTHEKTELLVFITPHVVMTDEEARGVTLEKEAESRAERTPYRLDAAEHYREAKSFYKDKDYPRAIQSCQQALQSTLDPKLRKKILRLMRKASRRLSRESPPRQTRPAAGGKPEMDSR